MCAYNFSLGNGKSTINVLGVGSGTGKEPGSTADAGGLVAESDTGILSDGDNYPGTDDINNSVPRSSREQ